MQDLLAEKGSVCDCFPCQTQLSAELSGREEVTLWLFSMSDLTTCRTRWQSCQFVTFPCQTQLSAGLAGREGARLWLFSMSDPIVCRTCWQRRCWCETVSNGLSCPACFVCRTWMTLRCDLAKCVKFMNHRHSWLSTWRDSVWVCGSDTLRFFHEISFSLSSFSLFFSFLPSS